MPRKKFKPIEMGPELWSEKLRRAYYRSKKTFGSDEVSYRALAERISKVKQMSGSGLEALMHRYPEKPTRQGTLQTVWLMCLAMGVNPESVDVSPDDITNELYKSKMVADLLRPSCGSSTTCAA